MILLRDQKAFRVQVKTWQQTESSGWMWFASALPIPPSASLAQTFSHGLTLLHNQQQDHGEAHHVHRKWARVSKSLFAFIVHRFLWYNGTKIYVYFQLLWYKNRESKREKRMNEKSTGEVKKFGVHPTWSLGDVWLLCPQVTKIFLTTHILITIRGSRPTCNWCIRTETHTWSYERSKLIKITDTFI